MTRARWFPEALEARVSAVRINADGTRRGPQVLISRDDIEVVDYLDDGTAIAVSPRNNERFIIMDSDRI